MFAAERKRIIIKYLLENNKAEVVKISEMLNVSEVTIRRDFEKLENEGFLIRTHGGAILHDPSEKTYTKEPAVKAAEDEENNEIAETAMALVKENDVIMITSGDISRLLAKKLSAKNGLTILTNDLIVALNASAGGQNRVICLGGEIDQDNVSVTGTITLRNMQKYHVNRVFIEVDGISEKLELSVSSQQKAELIESAIESADHATLLCHYTLFGTKAFMKLGSVTMVNSFITNPILSDKYKAAIYDKNVVLYTSINAFEGNV
ncbi:MAG: DeoR/GlpR transcriptional regulator [Spirochaetes bacterium]|nr:DeoR/GlpR transcriptional regulator [Spirochaetota bacterium]MBN2769877.1 DeoR/GlpR transcriptional regulator [Spirochaetota bacterium]